MKRLIRTKPSVETYLSGETIDIAFRFDISSLIEEPIATRIEKILELTEKKKVIHIGCADHLDTIDEKIQNRTHLHLLLNENSSECIGIDIHPEAIHYLAQKYGIHNILQVDVLTSDLSKCDEIISRHWDYVVLGEILEHVNNPVDFLKTVKNNLKPYADHILISVPNVFNYSAIHEYMNHKVERINSDHRYWFSPYTLAKVIYESGILLEYLVLTDCLYRKDRFSKLVKKCCRLFGIRKRPSHPTHMAQTLICVGKLR